MSAMGRQHVSVAHGRTTVISAIFVLLAGSIAMAADDPLAKARQLYNLRDFQAAVSAAEQARLIPSKADAADLVAARAYLERFRDSSAAEDLTNARDRLRRIDPQRFPSRERVEYLVGLGEALYLDGAYGAAAHVFESALQGNDLLTGPPRDRVVDWWASAVDRDARPRPDIDRQLLYQRLRERLAEELAGHPSSGAAVYWAAAAAHAQGDEQAAWDAAEAGWVRARLAGDRSESLRADLDRLVLVAIVPDRAKALAQPPETVRSEWDRFKEQWKP